MKYFVLMIIILSFLVCNVFAVDLREFYESQTDINIASLEEIKQIEGLTEKQAEAIYEWREVRGYFKSIYDLLKVSEIDIETFEKIKYKVRIEIPDVDQSETYRRIANLQTRLASEDGGPTEIAIDEWEDLLLDLQVNCLINYLDQ